MSEENRIERCFWCGRPKDQTITEETEETIKQSVINNYNPCEKCKEQFADGVHVIGVTKEPIVKGMFPISKDGDNVLYPTGSMFVANDDFIKDLISEPSEEQLLHDVLEKRLLMLPDEFVVDIVEQARKEQQGEDLDTYINDDMENAVNEEDVHSESDEESMA